MNEAAEQLLSTHAPTEALTCAIAQVNEVVVGKEDPVRLCFTALLANGHLLLEDLPGVGKTTLAQALAATLGLDYRRIQFTSDMLPADILGVSIYRRDREAFEFHPGPVFTQVLLADEVNRGTPKTQSALLEAMAERQVTFEGARRVLPEPFFVIATQNPLELAGTFPLPESQLDRFLMRLSVGYPDAQAERRLLEEPDRQQMLPQLEAQLDHASLLELQQQAARVHVSPALLDYVQALIGATREGPHIRVGLSPRGGLALLACARAHALVMARQQVIPEDVQAVFGPVATHRLRTIAGDEEELQTIVRELVETTDIP